MQKQWLAALALVLAPALAHAVLVVDQQQPGLDLSYPLLEIGGKEDKRLAQTFTVGLEGIPRIVALPVQCESGILLVEMVRLDGDLPSPILMLDRGVMEAASLPPIEPLEFRDIPLEELPPVPGDRFPIGSAVFVARPGERMAIVISNPTGRCTMARGVAVDPYTPGQGFFDERPLPRGWLPLTGNIEPSDDLPFKIILEADSPSQPCDLFGVTPDPDIPAFLPICRCLEDESLLEQRCGFFHPSFFLIRRIPWPLPPNEAFKVSWTLVPLTDLPGEVVLKESLPSLSKKPLVFRAAKPGSSVTLDYKVAGVKGTLLVDTVIVPPSEDAIRMQSVVEVKP